MDLTAEALLELTHIRDGQLSPDGEKLAYCTSTIDETQTEVFTLFLGDLGAGFERVVLSGPASISSLRWSADGCWLGFMLADRGGISLKIVDRLGAGLKTVAEAIPGIHGALTWSPDGTRIAVCGANPVMMAGYERVTSRTFHSRTAGAASGHSYMGRLEGFVSVHALDGSEPRRLDTGDTLCMAPKWAPSGSKILVLASASGAAKSNQTRLCTIDAETGSLLQLADEAWAITFAEWFPDGRRIAIVGSLDSDIIAPPTALWLINSDGSGAECRSYPEIPNVGLRAHHQLPIWDLTFTRGLAFSDDGNVLATCQVGGRASIMRISLCGERQFTEIVGGDRSCLVLGASSRAGRLLFLAMSPTDPGDLFLLEADRQGQETRLTDVNRERRAACPEMRIEHLRFRSADGTALEGWFMARKDCLGPLPTVLFIHGGPFMAAGHSFRADNFLLAAHGFGVLFSNFRGSIGYGDDFARAINGDWGERGYPDHMAAVDAAIAAGLADPARLGVWGSSHGGFAACWIVGHTDRFRAAVAEAAITNFATTYYLSDAPDLFARDLGGRPDQIPDVYRARSPLTYAPRCTTPTLMMHAVGDTRCSIVEAEQFYRVLKDVGCPTEFVRLAGGHLGEADGPVSTRLGHNEALLDWFGRHL